MNVEVFYCLKDAVTLAKKEQIRTVAALKSRLGQYDYKPETINEAVQYWANYERGKVN